jgi:hypothetical protein
MKKSISEEEETDQVNSDWREVQEQMVCPSEFHQPHYCILELYIVILGSECGVSECKEGNEEKQLFPLHLTWKEACTILSTLYSVIRCQGLGDNVVNIMDSNANVCFQDTQDSWREKTS